MNGCTTLADLRKAPSQETSTLRSSSQEARRYFSCPAFIPEDKRTCQLFEGENVENKNLVLFECIAFQRAKLKDVYSQNLSFLFFFCFLIFDICYCYLNQYCGFKLSFALLTVMKFEFLLIHHFQVVQPPQYTTFSVRVPFILPDVRPSRVFLYYCNGHFTYPMKLYSWKKDLEN